MNLDMRALADYYARLAPRERMLLAVAVPTLIGMIVYSMIWVPLQEQRTMLQRQVMLKVRELREVQQQRDEYLDLQRRLEANHAAIAEGDQQFNLFAYIENTIRQAVTREHIKSMNPSSKDVANTFEQEMVEIQLTEVSLPQIIDLLYRIEKGKHPLRFSRVRIKKRPKDIHAFDLSATVSLLKAVEEVEAAS